MPDSTNGGPVVEYLLKEVSFSTCDNKFFGELEKEMLIPNNLIVYGRISGATTLRDYKLLAKFPEDTVIAYLKHPLSNTVKDNERTLTYALEDLINYEDYWWLPLQGDTEFVLSLNLLPPFPQLNPVDLMISCTPDIAVGVDTEVSTRITIGGEENIDNLFLTMSAPPFANRGVSMSISDYSDDDITEPRQMVTAPRREFPFPQLSLKKGETKEYTVKSRIVADAPNMTQLKCQQDILRLKLIVLSKSVPKGPPCEITILNSHGEEIPVRKTERSTILQAQAQIMYSPFTIRRDKPSAAEKRAIEAPAV
jgi:hypothetical protein